MALRHEVRYVLSRSKPAMRPADYHIEFTGGAGGKNPVDAESRKRRAVTNSKVRWLGAMTMQPVIRWVDKDGNPVPDPNTKTDTGFDA